MSTDTKWRSEKESRSGTYRDVSFEVVRWRTLNPDGTPYEHDGRRILPEWTWNYYLHLPVEMLPERLRDEFNTQAEALCGGKHEHHPAPDIIERLEWHGGLTFWEKSTDDDGAPTHYKAGCDYAHSFDLDGMYTVDSVAADARRTINDLWRAIPDMLRRCGYTGDYVPQSEGFRTLRGDWMSFDGARKDAEWSLSRRTEAP